MDLKKNETKFEIIESKLLEAAIDKAMQGDEKAFHLLYDLYYSKIFNKCFCYTKDHDEAKDLTQEVFIKAFGNLHNLRDKNKFSSWIMKITVNTCNANYKGRGKLFENLFNYYNHLKLEKLFDEDINIEDDFEIVRDQIDKISNEEIKKTISGFYIEGLKTKDIAKRQNITKSTVTSRLDRFRVKIQKRLMLKIIESREKKRIF